MPKRRRGPVDDSEEESDASYEHPKDEINDGDDSPSSPPMEWPVVLKTGQPSDVGSKRPRSNSVKKEEDDDGDGEYTESDASSEEEAEEEAGSDEEFEYSDGGFVVDSDDNTNSKAYRNHNKRRGRPRRTLSAAEERRKRAEARKSTRGRRGRPRKSTIDDDSSEAEDSDDSEAFDASDGSIAEELRELKGQESPARRAGRNFRIRAPVNYMIPPPPTVEEVAMASAKQAEATAAAKNKDPRARRLFDVSGPFGGHDVHSIFNVSRDELDSVVNKTSNQLGGSGYSTSGNYSSRHPSTLGAGYAGNTTGGFGGSAPAASGGGNDADVDPVEITGVDFSMVGGLDSYIAKLKEMVSLPLLYPELYEKFGITPPRGVLFHGPPGTGKTLMARALAASHKQEKVTFYMRKGADVLSKWIGESERQLRALFDEARAHQPSIIFFDEIDGLAPVRSAKQEQHHASIVSTLLALMDGMDNRGQVVVIGATNRPDSVDPALRRPGRFDREFYFPLPDFEARQKILEIHTRKWQPVPSSELLQSISHQTKGYGGADLRALATEAALLAINRAYPQIYNSSQKLTVDAASIQVRPQDFTLALERIQPSTARAAGVSLAQPIPARVEPLLRDTFAKVASRVRMVFPNLSKEAKLSALFLNESQFEVAQAVSKFQRHRIHRPRLLLAGPNGNGQSYISKAISTLLEGVYVRELSTSLLFSSGALTPESALVNVITEVRQRSPACLLLSSLGDWSSVPHLVALLAGLLRSLSPEEPVFVVASDEIEGTDEEQVILSPLIDFFNGEKIDMKIDTSKEVLGEFFAPVFSFIRRNPVNCLEAHELPKPPIPKLKPSEVNEPTTKDHDSSQVTEKADAPSSRTTTNTGIFDETDRRDLRVRSQLKLKLGIILDGFRQKYRRFRKPVIDESKLVYLFEEPIQKYTLKSAQASPEAVNNADTASTDDAEVIDVEANGNAPAEHFERIEDRGDNEEVDDVEEDDDDDEHPYVISPDHRILEKSTGKKYFNMDLETVEDRLWNGFYCVPEQFLNDIEMIYRDAVEQGERERMHKASEMLANAQVAIDDICLDKQFLAGCEAVHTKDAEIRLSELRKNEQGGVEGANTDEPNEPAQPIVEGTSTISNGADTETTTERSMEVEVIAKETVTEGEDSPVISPQDYKEQVDRHVQLDESVFKKFESNLLDASVNFTLEELEELFAVLSDIAWQYRSDWNRDAMIGALSDHVSRVKELSSRKAIRH